MPPSALRAACQLEVAFSCVRLTVQRRCSLPRARRPQAGGLPTRAAPSCASCPPPQVILVWKAEGEVMSGLLHLQRTADGNREQGVTCSL